MNEDLKKVLENSVKALKSKGGLNNKELRPMILSIEKLIKRRTKRKIKKA